MADELREMFESWRTNIEDLIKRHPLQIISWEATRRCNLHCKHCGSPSESVVLEEELSAAEVTGAFDQIAETFDMSEFHHVNITGGEPFVREDLVDILASISRWAYYRNIDIQTNGLYLADHPEVFELLKQNGVTGIGVSIDGFEKTHDSFRQRPGSYTKAFEAAKEAVRAGFTVTVGCVAHSGNADEISEFFFFVRDKISPRFFRVMTLDPQGRTEPDSPMLLSPSDLNKVIKFLSSEYQRSCSTYADPETTMVELGCGGWMGLSLEGLFRPFIFHCIAGIINLGILYDGKLAACSNISREFIEGDLRTEPIMDVWERRYGCFRNFEWKRKGACISCDQWEYCHGGPMHKRTPEGEMCNCLYLLYQQALESMRGGECNEGRSCG